MLFAGILNVICTLNESFWIFHYADLILDEDTKWSRFWYLAGILGNVILVLGMNQIVFVLPYTDIISMLFVMFSICIGWKTDFLTAIALTGLYFLLIMLKGTLEVSIVRGIGGETLLEQILEEKGWERCSYLCIGGGVWFLMNFLVSKQMEQRVWKKNARFFVIVSLLGIIGTTFFAGMILTGLRVETNMAMYGFLIIFSSVMVGSYYWVKVKCSKLEQEQKSAIEHRIATEEKYERLKKDYMANIKLYHDMNHHLDVIYQIAKTENVSGIVDYIKEMKVMADVSEMSEMKVWTGIDVIDIILTEKYEQAKEMGIEVETHVQMLPGNIQITNWELSSLFGNLLSNCIEANPTYIKILIKKAGQMLLVQTRNDFVGERIKENKRYKTSKKDAQRHGLGIQNMEDIVKNHNGSLDYWVENNVFCVDIFMSLFS